MDLALHYPRFHLTDTITATLAKTARAADAGGVSTFTVMDHYLQMENYGPLNPMLEGYTTLGYLAGVTERMRLSLLVTGVTYRHPGLLAKIATTLDMLSSGRGMLGLGAAWYEREHHAYGVPFPPVAERFERLEEALQICRQMWSDDDGPYDGKYYQLAETICVPSPVQQPRPPIMIGGQGERKTLRLVAQYADVVNLTSSADQIPHKLDVLRRHCDDVGRDIDTIERSIFFDGNPLDNPSGFLSAMQTMSGLGVGTVWLSNQTDDSAGWISRVCDEVLPQLREI